MRTTEMVLCAHYLKTSKFIPVCISIYILSLIQIHSSVIQKYMLTIFFLNPGFSRQFVHFLLRNNIYKMFLFLRMKEKSK